MACDPTTLQNLTPCLQCLSVTELKQFLVALWAEQAGYTFPADLDTLLDSSACNACESVKQLLENEVATMMDTANASFDTLRANTKCLKCLDPGRINALILFLKCTFWATHPPT